MSDFLITDPAPEAEAAALLDAAFGPQRRLKASYRLREGARPVPGLGFSLRDAQTGRLAGVISFWPLRTGGDGRAALLLGPLAVHPDFQGAGLGGRLMRRGLEAARAQGHALVFLVGDEPYYGRFGFRVVPEGRILLPGPFDPARLLYAELAPGAFSGARGLLLPEHRWRGEGLRRRP